MNALKKQQQYDSGKKKRHTIKSQIVVDKRSEPILCMVQPSGSVHDFKMSKESMGSAVSSEMMLKADSGYQGLMSYHGKSELPTKRSKCRPLKATERLANRRLASERVLIERINHRIKIFKMMSYPYRNRRKRHKWRLALLCARLNSEKEKTVV